MYAQQTQETEQKLLTLKGEVRLLEKRKEDLLKEIERIQVVKGKEIPELQNRVKELKTERDGLVEEITAYNKAVQKAEVDLETARKNLRFFTEGQIAQINREIDEKLNDLEERTEAIDSKDMAIVETLAALGEAEEEILHKGAGLAVKENELRELQTDLHDLEKLLEVRARESTDKLIKAKFELDSLLGKIEEAKKEANSLTINNGILELENQKMVSDMKKTVDEITRREKEVSAREEFNTDWEARLKNEEARLKDEFARKEKYA